MVSGIDGGRDQRRGLRVGAGDNDEFCAHHVRLGPTGHKAVDVFLYRYHHLAGHVTTLFSARRLILNVNAGGARLDEHPNELQRCRKATVARIGIGDDGSQIVNPRETQTLPRRQAEPLLPLFTVVEKLGFEELVDLC